MAARTAAGLALGVVALAISGTVSASSAVDRTLTVTVSGKGKVTSIPARIACPGRCQAKFANSATVTLRAAPGAGWKFSRWTGGCAGTKARCSLVLKTPKRVGAVFVKPPKPPPPPPAGFTPQTLAGNWQGSWNDTRFSTTGPASVVVAVQPDGTSFTFMLALGGNVFGCPPPPAVGFLLTPGDGANHWNRDGFSLAITGPQGGSINVRYDFGAQTLTGNGRPGCRPGVTWALQGTFSGSTFNGSMTTTLEDASTAPAVITLTRS